MDNVPKSIHSHDGGTEHVLSRKQRIVTTFAATFMIVVLFFIVAALLPFRARLFNILFSKPLSDAQSVPTGPGDIVVDSVVNVFDLGRFTFCWEKTVPPNDALLQRCNMQNADTVIDAFDLGILAGLYGTRYTGNTPTSTPTPGGPTNTPTSTPTATPTPGGINPDDPIIVTVDETGKKVISVASNGTVVVLHTSLHTIRNLEMSPNKAVIAFETDETDPKIWVGNVDGTGFTEKVAGRFPVLADDTLAFTKVLTSGENALVSMKLVGLNVTTVITTTDATYRPFAFRPGSNTVILYGKSFTNGLETLCTFVTIEECEDTYEQTHVRYALWRNESSVTMSYANVLYWGAVPLDAGKRLVEANLGVVTDINNDVVVGYKSDQTDQNIFQYDFSQLPGGQGTVLFDGDSCMKYSTPSRSPNGAHLAFKRTDICTGSNAELVVTGATMSDLSTLVYLQKDATVVPDPNTFNRIFWLTDPDVTAYPTGTPTPTPTPTPDGEPLFLSKTAHDNLVYVYANGATEPLPYVENNVTGDIAAVNLSPDNSSISFVELGSSTNIVHIIAPDSTLLTTITFFSGEVNNVILSNSRLAYVRDGSAGGTPSKYIGQRNFKPPGGIWINHFTNDAPVTLYGYGATSEDILYVRGTSVGNGSAICLISQLKNETCYSGFSSMVDNAILSTDESKVFYSLSGNIYSINSNLSAMPDLLSPNGGKINNISSDATRFIRFNTIGQDTTEIAENSTIQLSSAGQLLYKEDDPCLTIIPPAKYSPNNVYVAYKVRDTCNTPNVETLFVMEIATRTATEITSQIASDSRFFWLRDL